MPTGANRQTLPTCIRNFGPQAQQLHVRGVYAWHVASLEHIDLLEVAIRPFLADDNELTSSQGSEKINCGTQSVHCDHTPFERLTVRQSS